MPSLLIKHDPDLSSLHEECKYENETEQCKYDTILTCDECVFGRGGKHPESKCNRLSEWIKDYGN